MIAIVLVDDHAMVRAGLQTLLETEPDFDIVGVVGTGLEAVDLVRETAPDVILMDMSMPGMDGIEATRRISANNPDMRVVMLTAHAEQDRILDAIDAGAIGYLLKDSDPTELIRGVRAAANGVSPLDPKAASAMIRDRRPSKTTELTTREREVLDLVAKGLANKQIARRLAISEKTVKSHLTKVYAVLGVADRTQAALWLQERRGSTGS